MSINIRGNQRDNEEWIIQRHCENTEQDENKEKAKYNIEN